MSDRTSRCECGQRKPRGAIACERCTYLDGNKNASLIVAALRVLGPSTVRELTEANSSLYKETTQRTLQRLLATGRVRRYWRDGDPIDAVKPVFANGGGHVRVMSRIGFDGCFVYALTEHQRSRAA